MEEADIKPGDKFDESVAEAIMNVPCGDGEQPNTVKLVLKKGYRQNGKVIRFAQVSVTAPSSISRFEGTPFTLEAMEYTVTGVERAVGLWSSSLPRVISVDPYTGEMTVNGAGTAVISYTLLGTDKAGSATLTVDGLDLTGISFDKETETLTGSESKTLSYTISEVGAAYDEVTFSSSDAGIVSVSADGVIRGLKNGKATITVTVTGGDSSFSDTIEITVSGILEFTGIALDKTSATMKAGDTLTLNVSLQGQNLPEEFNVTLISEDTSVATANRTQITAVAAGTTTVTARVTINGVTHTASIEITVEGGGEQPGGNDEGGCSSTAVYALPVLALIPLAAACVLVFIKRKDN